ncbi:MAG: phosphate ABC transporter permease subunit PstC [Phascolarctobacterium sp.]|nr:phosphate ABC transporter permease subunit PstC [Phascolarctobacterium sp.]
MNKNKEKIMQLVFLAAACASIALVAMICFFLFANGLPTIGKIGISDFLLGQKWRPNNDIYGILPMIMGSIYVTLGACITGVPIGILTAIFMARFCPSGVYKFLKPAVELLAGIPSVIYGFFGLVVLVPFIRDTFGGTGSSMLTASLLLGMMILPTLISVAEAALRAVPDSYYEGALALGAGHVRSVFFTVVPAAKSGIMAAIILGVGRAIGETMAVIMVAGNQARMPQGLLEGVRTMTTNIVIEMGYAADLHRDALIATAVVLFIFIMLINLTFSYLKGKVVQQ